ncbi:unnamed protein product [Rhizophagus irregularis]|uniref:Uncharacterized protein n=1 Tax=Rhizophagus irregularis TaxID=588596 RepID=A0A915ZD54_9GLOM|nr:unnamed protein product [Rhizophagus irregularis]
MQIKEKFRWQAFKRIEDRDKRADVDIIKSLVKGYKAFFGKMIRVKKRRFVILYFHNWISCLYELRESAKKDTNGSELRHKSENNLIDEDGNLYEKTGRINDFDLPSGQSGQYMDEGCSVRQQNLRTSNQRDSYIGERESLI